MSSAELYRAQDVMPIRSDAEYRLVLETIRTLAANVTDETQDRHFLRRTKMAPQEPLVSYAGFQIQLPLIPRSNTGFSHLAVRGTGQWSYAVEPKILEKDNRITPGFGVIPRAGDSLAQWPREPSLSAFCPKATSAD